MSKLLRLKPPKTAWESSPKGLYVRACVAVRLVSFGLMTLFGSTLATSAAARAIVAVFLGLIAWFLSRLPEEAFEQARQD